MKTAFLSLLLLSVLSVSAWAGSFSFDFNDHSTQLGYVQNLNTQTYGETVAKLRYLYNDDSRTNLGGIALGVTGTPGNMDGLKLGIDVGVNGGQTRNDQELLAVGLGFLTSYNPPMLGGFGLEGRVLYSPEIFTFLDAEDYFEWGFGVNYQVLPNAKITLGFQNVKVDLKNSGERDLDETVRFGIQLDF